ncbi:antibiotic biosynthesis monooxygenase [Mechercharimyces sp. CAU 1602]|nr:antibiotic biosynthesis monooxygenase [Mechercharimyces sp. CAU 1602]
MYQVNNKITIISEEQAQHLRERFMKAPQSMKEVPGFISFRLLRAEDGSHFIVETTFTDKEAFQQWTASDHFQQAHGGKRKQNSSSDNLAAYDIIIA